MNKLTKTVCLLMVLAFLMQGCAKDKDGNDKEDTKEISTTSSTSAYTDDSAFNSQSSSEKTTVVLNQPTTAATTAPATTTSSNNHTSQKNDSNITSNKAEVKTETSGLTYVKGILIVNKTYSIPSNYNPGVNAEAQSAFNQMASAASKEGLTLTVISGFRSYSTQASLYNNYVAQDGKANADRYSARPGHSEHQTGLAFDVNSVSQSFENTAEGKWLAANCSKYGFIIRFPKGKESVTGYMYEPWHIRYLGVSTAEAVQKSGLTLEEYLGINSVYAN